MQLGYWLIVELHFKRFSSSDEGLCDSVYTLSAFSLSALAIWAAKWGYYTTIVQVERLSKRKLVEPFPCPFSYFPPQMFSLSSTARWRSTERKVGDVAGLMAPVLCVQQIILILVSFFQQLQISK